jgi:hypothetical protein
MWGFFVDIRYTGVQYPGQINNVARHLYMGTDGGANRARPVVVTGPILVSPSVIARGP